jgi:arylsulfatase A-like enzyme
VFFQNARKAKGAPSIATPNLDKMAAEGVRLEGMYCPAPVCAPSRGSLLSGVHQGHAGVRDNQFDKALENNHTLATILKNAGYATAVIGKWGLQGLSGKSPAAWPGYPTKRGFDDFFGYVRHSDGHVHYPKEGIDTHPSEIWDNDVEISASLDKCYTTDLFTARAKKWIVDTRKAAPEKPFFLYLAYDTPHSPQQIPTGPYPSGSGLTGGLQWTGKPGAMINTAKGAPDSYHYPEYANATRDGKPWPELNRRHATSITRIDECVGDLLALLRDLKIDEDTLVVFTSDNGPSFESLRKNRVMDLEFFDDFGPFSGTKRDCLEGGVRVGAIVREPGVVPAGRASTEPAQFHDWMPTFAELAGIPAPARTDGVSLVPMLTGKGAQKPSTVYVEYNFPGTTPNYSAFAKQHRGRKRGQMQLIRFGDKVGVRYDIKSHADDFEIYDIANDPKEVRDIAKENHALEQKMKDAVLRLRRPDPSAKRPYDKEPVPPVADADAKTAPGVAWRAYSGDFAYLPKFDDMTPARSGEAQDIAAALKASGGEGVLISGYITVPEDSEYTFAMTPDSSAFLRIHEASVIDADFGHKPGEPKTALIRLKAGKHPFRLYFAGKGHPNLRWSKAGGAPQPLSAATLSHDAK